MVEQRTDHSGTHRNVETWALIKKMPYAKDKTTRMGILKLIEDAGYIRDLLTNKDHAGIFTRDERLFLEKRLREVESESALEQIKFTLSGTVERNLLLDKIVHPDHMHEVLTKRAHLELLTPGEQLVLATRLRASKHWGLIAAVIRSSHVQETRVNPILPEEQPLLEQYFALKTGAKSEDPKIRQQASDGLKWAKLPKGKIETRTVHSGIHIDALLVLSRANQAFFLEHGKTVALVAPKSNSPV